MFRRKFILSTLALGAVGFASAAWWFKNQQSISEKAQLPIKDNEALIRSYSPIIGDKDAPVTIVEFFDPACEACRAFHPIIKNILTEHNKSVRVVIRYTTFHGEASQVAVRYLEAARMQGIFEQVLEALLIAQPQWASHGRMRPELIASIAQSAGLDLGKAQSQIRAPQTAGILNQDSKDVQTRGVRQTPTFFVNNNQLEPLSEARLRDEIAKAVAEIGE